MRLFETLRFKVWLWHQKRLITTGVNKFSTANKTIHNRNVEKKNAYSIIIDKTEAFNNKKLKNIAVELYRWLPRQKNQ